VPNLPLAQKSFWTNLMVLLGDEAQIEHILVCLVIVLILRHEWCMVCAKRTTGSKIALDTPNGMPR
jgi:hypothetical protein